MKKFLVASLVVLAVLAAAACIYIMTSEDPNYLLRETAFAWRYKKYDDLIRQAAARYGVAPELIKAVIWRRANSNPKVGAQGGAARTNNRKQQPIGPARKSDIRLRRSFHRVNIEAGVVLNRAFALVCQEPLLLLSRIQCRTLRVRHGCRTRDGRHRGSRHLQRRWTFNHKSYRHHHCAV
jgi:hypothetical protein